MVTYKSFYLFQEESLISYQKVNGDSYIKLYYDGFDPVNRGFFPVQNEI